MKTFRMIGMALAAILMCVNLASCDEDDDESRETSTNTTNNGGNGGIAGNEGNGGNSEKKLAKFMLYDLEDGNKVLDESVEFVYGVNGNVLKIVYGWLGDYGWKECTDECIWNSSNSFTLDYGDDDEFVKFVLNNGRVTKEIWYDKDDEEFLEAYLYDYNNGFIKMCKEDIDYDPWYQSFSWEGGKLSSVNNSNSIISFIYGDKTCKKGFFPLLSGYINSFDDLEIFVAQPELVGLKTIHLPKEIITKNGTGSETSTFEYEFDSEGYVVGCTAYSTYKSGSYSNTYTEYYAFFWE